MLATTPAVVLLKSVHFFGRVLWNRDVGSFISPHRELNAMPKPVTELELNAPPPPCYGWLLNQYLVTKMLPWDIKGQTMIWGPMVGRPEWTEQLFACLWHQGLV